MATMSRDADRRCITVLLFALLACVLTFAHRDPKELAILLTPVTALLLRVVRFYFPNVRQRPTARDGRARLPMS